MIENLIKVEEEVKLREAWELREFVSLKCAHLSKRVVGKTCFNVAVSHRTTSAERALEWFRLGAKYNEYQCRKILKPLDLLFSLKRMEKEELMLCVGVIDSVRYVGRTPVDHGHICFDLACFQDLSSTMRGRGWLELGVQLENKYCENALKVLSGIGEVELEPFKQVVEHSTCLSSGYLFWASQQKNLQDAHHFLLLAVAAGPNEYSERASLYEATLSYVMADTQYKRDEVLYRLRQMNICGFGCRPPYGPFYRFTYDHAKYNYPEGCLSPSFYVKTLLCGSLNKNQDSVLHRSFFRSPMREVHLLPIIAAYLTPDLGKYLTAASFSSRRIRSIPQLCSGILEGVSTLHELEVELGGYDGSFGATLFPLFFSRIPYLETLVLHCYGCMSGSMIDLSFLSYLDTSRLKEVRISLPVFDSHDPLCFLKGFVPKRMETFYGWDGYVKYTT